MHIQASSRQYRDLLVGIMYKEPDRVVQSGIKDVFYDAVREYNREISFDYKSWLDNHNNIKYEAFSEYITNVGLKLGVSKDASDLLMDSLSNADAERLHYLGQVAPDGVSDWFDEGFTVIYGEPFDLHEDMRQYMDERSHELDQDEISDNWVDDGLSEFDAYVRYDESRTRAEELSKKGAYDPYGVQFDDRFSDTPYQSDGLFGVSLDGSGYVALEQPYDRDKDFEMFLNDLSVGLKPLTRHEAMSQSFEYHFNQVVDMWALTKERMLEDPERFKDAVAFALNGVSHDTLDPDDRFIEGQSYIPVFNVFGINTEPEVVAEFSEGYKSVYDVPIDAYRMTMGQVSREMGKPVPDGSKGHILYRDVFEAQSPEDIQRLIDAHEAYVRKEQAIQAELMEQYYREQEAEQAMHEPSRTIPDIEIFEDDNDFVF